jgi:hypothetical protein
MSVVMIEVAFTAAASGMGTSLIVFTLSMPLILLVSMMLYNFIVSLVFVS